MIVISAAEDEFLLFGPRILDCGVGEMCVRAHCECDKGGQRRKLVMCSFAHTRDAISMSVVCRLAGIGANAGGLGELTVLVN